MATMSERLAYVLDFNTSGAIRDVQKFGSVAERELGQADERLDRLGSNMTRFGAGAMAFAGIAGAGLFKLGQGAAMAEANMAALEQVVGETVAQGVAEWAEGSALAVGLASRDAIAAATSFSQLGKIIGLGGEALGAFSTDLVGLSADFAAFKDVSPEQALQDIQAAFAGSTEVMRKYGIFLDDATLKAAYFRETGEEVTGTLTAQQKIVAINSELYRQGADMIGQWSRESGELNGQQAQLRANLTNLSDNIGKGLLPMVTSMVGALNTAGGAFAALSPEMQATAGRFAALGTAAIGLVGGLSFVGGQLIKMRERFTSLDEATGERSLNNLGRAARGLGVGIGLASVALAGYSIQQAQAAGHARDAAVAMQELSRVADDQLFQTFNRTILEAALGGQNLDSIMKQLAATNIEGARRLLEYSTAQGQTNASTNALSSAIAEEERARQQAAATTARHGDVVEGTIPDIEGATAATGEMTGALGEVPAAATAAGTGLSEGFTRGAATVVDRATAAVNSAISAVVAGRSGMESAGANLADGMSAGIYAKAREVANAAASIVRGALDAARSFARISSPSKLFAEDLGEPIGQGIAVGIEDESPTVDQAVVGDVSSARRALGSSPTRIGSGGGSQINIYTNADPAQVAEAVRRYGRRN